MGSPQNIADNLSPAREVLKLRSESAKIFYIAKGISGSYSNYILLNMPNS